MSSFGYIGIHLHALECIRMHSVAVDCIRLQSTAPRESIKHLFPSIMGICGILHPPRPHAHAAVCARSRTATRPYARSGVRACSSTRTRRYARVAARARGRTRTRLHTRAAVRAPGRARSRTYAHAAASHTNDATPLVVEVVYTNCVHQCGYAAIS